MSDPRHPKKRAPAKRASKAPAKTAASGDIERGVLEWLRRHGHPFELSVAQIFRDNGWQVDHGRAYIDPVTEKVRPIDLVATLHRSVPGDDAGVAVTIVVECKKSIDPWVAFTAERDPDVVFFSALFAADRLTHELVWEMIPDAGDIWGEWFSVSRTLGHGVVRIPWNKDETRPKADPEHQPYAAFQSVLSACVALGAEHREACERDNELDFAAPLELTFPAVVVDARLYTFELTRDGSEKLSPTDVAKVYSPKPRGDGVVVPVMTPEGLRRLLASDTARFVEICRWLSTENVRLRKNIFGTEADPQLG